MPQSWPVSQSRDVRMGFLSRWREASVAAAAAPMATRIFGIAACEAPEGRAFFGVHGPVTDIAMLCDL